MWLGKGDCATWRKACKAFRQCQYELEIGYIRDRSLQ